MRLWEVFYNATKILIDDGTIKERLLGVELELCLLRPEDIPSEKIAEYDQLMQRFMTVRAAPNEGDVGASIGKMTVNEAYDCAKVVLNIYTWACKNDDKIHLRQLSQNNS